jgi:DNA-binding response OmpR family regulator
MHSPKRVLIVDDDREIVLGLCIRMRAAGYDVLTASDGRIGLAAAIEHRPDAIILDLRMPNMGGLEVLAQLRKQSSTRSIPVLVVSANVVEDTRVKALDLGARRVLVKPYQAADLIASVESILNDPKTVRSNTEKPIAAEFPAESKHELVQT